MKQNKLIIRVPRRWLFPNSTTFLGFLQRMQDQHETDALQNAQNYTERSLFWWLQELNLFFQKEKPEPVLHWIAFLRHVTQQSEYSFFPVCDIWTFFLGSTFLYVSSSRKNLAIKKAIARAQVNNA